MTRRRQPDCPWGRGFIRGLVDNKLPPFQLRIERVEEHGLLWTNVWAHKATHRVFAWGELPVRPYRHHPEGPAFLSERLVREAVERARVRDAECLALIQRFLNPDPPDRPTRLTLVA